MGGSMGTPSADGPNPHGLRTRAVHAGAMSPRPADAVTTPIFQSSTYALAEGVAYDDIRYLRLNNTPNQEVVARKLASLEGAPAGLVTGSGMAAISATLFGLLGPGDQLLIQTCVYGGTQGLVDRIARDHGITVTFVDVDDPASWEAARTERARAFYVESITNPLLDVGRLDEVVAFCRTHGLTSIIDNTFPTPIFFRPIELGYDVVVHSATKALNGHSDIVAGAVLSDAERLTKIRKTLNLLGGSLDAHAAFLLERGLKTLPLRLKAQEENAHALARHLSAHPKVSRVRFPGLPEDPAHERASEWFDGFGTMVGCFVDADPVAVDRALRDLEIGLLAPSLGGIETLVCRPATTSHAGQSAAQRAQLGITDGYVRISVGIEDADDLCRDFVRVLDRL